MNALYAILSAITIVSIGYFITAIRLARTTGSTAGIPELGKALPHVISALMGYPHIDHPQTALHPPHNNDQHRQTPVSYLPPAGQSAARGPR